MREREQEPTDEVLQPLATILAQRFIKRWDQFPQQLDDGRYITVHKPLLDEHLVTHLRGNITLATYALDPDSQGHFLVFDADDEPDWRRLKAVARALSELGSESYLERSRRGGHLWFFFDESKKGRDLRTFGHGLLGYFAIEGVEVFPKQDELKTGPGSSIRLPFGVHRLTSQRYSFYDSQGQVLASTLRGQLNILAQPLTVKEKIFSRFYDQGVELTEIERVKAPPAWEAQDKGVEGESLSDRIKRSIPVRQFVLQYVELSKSGKGLCPFHDDQVESFSVNNDENFWNCFAGCGGGSVIDFVMKLKDCDYKTAVSELSEMLFESKEGYESPLPGLEFESP